MYHINCLWNRTQDRFWSHSHTILSLGQKEICQRYLYATQKLKRWNTLKYDGEHLSLGMMKTTELGDPSGGVSTPCPWPRHPSHSLGKGLDLMKFKFRQLLIDEVRTSHNLHTYKHTSNPRHCMDAHQAKTAPPAGHRKISHYLPGR